MKRFIWFLVIIFFSAGILFYIGRFKPDSKEAIHDGNLENIITNPLQIKEMRKRDYPGSPITIKETLGPGSNYNQYVASYLSDGLKIYALLTIPMGEKPAGGWPVIVFNHGYIPPDQYRTTERYSAYVDAFARNGYIVFKPDYRGHGSSEGRPEGAYYSPAYTVDDLNAIASVKKLPDANADKIGVWGHSLGGNITLRDLVIRPEDVKAAVIWAGVVGSYDDLMNRWRRTIPFQPSQGEAFRSSYRQQFINQFGTPQTNPDFWNSIDPTFFAADVKAPVQIHHGLEDEQVPFEFSQSLYNKLIGAGKAAELYTYQGSDHNIAQGFGLAIQRSVEFFDKHLK